MKLALCGDLHLGASKDSDWIQQYQKDFFEFMVSECEKRGVKELIQTGDWFDVRRGITATTMNFNRDVVVPTLSYFDHVHVDVGNHDMQLKDRITPNSVTELLGGLDGFTVYDKPSTVDFDGRHIDIIPWICRGNSDEINEFIGSTDSKIAVGHFELAGFKYTGGISTGLSPDFLSKYDKVWSGHYHNQSEGQNVRYLGTPYTLTLGDANESRGFFIYDTELDDLTYIENPVCNHIKVYFNADTFLLTDLNAYTNKFVKFVCEKRSSSNSAIDFDKALDELYKVAYDVEKLDEIDLDVNELDDNSDDELDVKDTDYYIHVAVDALDESDFVKARINEIYDSLKLEANDLK